MNPDDTFLGSMKSLGVKIGRLTAREIEEFGKEFSKWRENWAHTLNRNTVSKRMGRSHYTHKHLRFLIFVQKNQRISLVLLQSQHLPMPQPTPHIPLHIPRKEP